MVEPEFIQTLIDEYQHLLQFDWLIKKSIKKFPVASTSNHWIGEYDANAYHPIAIIHQKNIGQFIRTLQQPAKLKPAVSILCDNCCTKEVLRLLHQCQTPALHSPLSAGVILHELAHACAEHVANQIQHGIALSIQGYGILLTGRSGIGKSAIALELISRGHQLVADDSPLLYRLPDSKQICAVCSPLLKDCLEVRGLGILDLTKLFGEQSTLPYTQIGLVIELVDNITLDAEIRFQVYNKHTNILGVDLHHLSLPISYPASLAVIVETATKNHVLYQQGNNSADKLITRQQDAISRQTV